MTRSAISSLSTAALLALVGCGAQPSPATSSSVVDPWPYSVGSVTLSCEKVYGDQPAVFVTTANGTKYSANSVASPFAWPIDLILAREDLGAIPEGLKLCETDSPPVKLMPKLPQPLPDNASQDWSVVAREQGGLVASLIATEGSPGDLPAVLVLDCDGEFVSASIDYYARAERPSSNVTATYSVDEGPPKPIQAGFAEGVSTFRKNNDDEARTVQRFIREALAGQIVTFIAPDGYGLDRPLAWDMSRLGAQRAAVEKACLNTPAKGTLPK